jgi:hypothetical protein
MTAYAPVPMLTIKKLTGALEVIATFLKTGPPANAATLNLIEVIATGTLAETKAEIAAIAEPAVVNLMDALRRSTDL